MSKGGGFAVKNIVVCPSFASGKRAISRPLFPPIFMPLHFSARFLPVVRTQNRPLK
jgi:hypothetical protein